MDYIQLLQSYVNMAAVLVAVVATQALKYFLPSPGTTEGSSGLVEDTMNRSFQIEAGKWWTRLLPFFPLFVGMTVCFALEPELRYTFAGPVKGCLSGALAAYLYRTTQVAIFGK